MGNKTIKYDVRGSFSGEFFTGQFNLTVSAKSFTEALKIVDAHIPGAEVILINPTPVYSPDPY